MGRSQRSNRGPAHYNQDRRGETHYPSETGYTYDWPGNWPSGSGQGTLAATAATPEKTKGKRKATKKPT